MTTRCRYPECNHCEPMGDSFNDCCRHRVNARGDKVRPMPVEQERDRARAAVHFAGYDFCGKQ